MIGFDYFDSRLEGKWLIKKSERTGKNQRNELTFISEIENFFVLADFPESLEILQLTQSIDKF